MAKGKKKGGKKEEEEPSLSSLTISESQPSTSQPPSTTQPPSTVAVEEDVGLGLTGGGRKKKPKKKAAEETPAAASPQESSPATSVPEAKAAAVPETKTVEVKEEESEGLGLGLGGGKKRNRKKKDSATPSPAGSTPTHTSVPVAAAPVATPAPVAQTAPVAQPAPVAPVPTYPVSTAPTQPAPGPIQTDPQQLPWGRGAGRGGGQPVGRPGPPWQQSAPVSQPAPIPQIQPSPAPQSHGHGVMREQTRKPIQTPQQSPQVSQPPSPYRQQTQAKPTEMYVSHFKIPSKIIGSSVRCRDVKVLTNYLPMTIRPLKVYRYDVAFKPDKPKKMIPLAYRAAKDKYFPKEIIAFDQMKNCYALCPLPNVPAADRFVTQVEVKDVNQRIMNFEVSFKATGVIDLKTIIDYMASGTSLSPPTEAIQCIDVVLRQGTLESYVKAGRQFFMRPARPIDLGDGLEMWTGLFQSAIFTCRPFINIDVAHKGFPKGQPMVDALSKDFRLDLNRPIDQQRGRGCENFQEFIKGLRVVMKLMGNTPNAGQTREYICNGIVDPPGRQKFVLTDPNGQQRQMTVADYFLKEKQYRLKYPNLNCMWIGPKDKTIFVPMELLEVAYGQPRNKQLNEMQLSTMVREAATPPNVRKAKIEEVIRNMNYPQNQYFKQFGLEISDQFFPVDAKILQPPSLEVGVRQFVVPRKGEWRANGLLKPEPLESWGFIAIDLDPNACNFDNIVSLLMNNGRQMGMNVSKPVMYEFNVRIQDLRNKLFTALEKDVKFLFVIVATRGRDYYHKVKQMAERDVGILTQCIKEYTATRRMNPQTARNILLKVNSKLMGINQALDVRSLPRCLVGGGVMVVGADVTHPSPDQSNIPSIAAVTASIDPKCYMYNIELSIQTPKKEMIVEFEDMMVDHFMIYKKHQNSLPKKIFVFRDGVSEGQFSQVMDSELTAVHRAYQRMTGTTAKPEVLFLLVQKRHHTRFFLPGQNSQYNVEPGTVVDTHIVHARELDFYLVSHQAIKGTARPTRYHAVCNDGRIPHDEVEQLTYYLCHLYSRCMRSVSYPTPTYYAHLACFRARSLTYGEQFDNSELERKPKRLRVLDKMLQKSRMFFV